MRSLFFHEALRAFVFSLFFVLFTAIGALTVASAASPDGGLIGQALNAILASGDWSAPGDGTVKNAAKLGGVSASSYARVKASQTCPTNQCVAGIQADGTVTCR